MTKHIVSQGIKLAMAKIRKNLYYVRLDVMFKGDISFAVVLPSITV